MNMVGRVGFSLLAALLVFAEPVSVHGVLPLSASDSAAQWRLDLDQAMDTIGLTPGMIVGEAGAGDGYFTLHMARRVGTTGFVFANDISRRALAELAERSERQGLKNIQTVVGAIDDPQFPRRDLELVVVVHAFHDFSEPVRWLVNTKKYLKPGAAVAIIDRDPYKSAESHFWSKERIIGLAREAGYELTKAADADTNHLILLFTPTTAVTSGSRR